MSDRDSLPQEIRDLLDAYCDDLIDDDRLRKLESYLLADEDARRAFVTYFQLHTELRFVLRAHRAVDSVLQSIDDPPTYQEHAPWRRWGVAIAAVLLVGFGALTWSRTAKQAATPPSVTVRPRPEVKIANGLAMVVKLDGVQWEPSDVAPPIEGNLLAAGRLRIKSGRAILSMLTGVELIVEGPADLELIAHDEVLCHQGKLRARVPEEAEGFVVTGPGSAVVDLGTEFGLNIHTDGSTLGKVFKGKVQAVLTSATGAYRRSRLIRDGGDAFEMDALTGRIHPSSAPEDFVSPSKTAVKPLILNDSYRDVILQSRPWSYWRFESDANNEIPNEIPGRPPLRVNGPIRLSDSVKGNRSAIFADSDASQYLEPNGLWNPPRHPGYSVELWFLSQTIGHFSLATLISDAPNAKRPQDPATLHFRYILELTSRVRKKLHQPASVRLLHRFPGSWNDSGDNLYSDRCYIPYRWHHVVGQMNEDRMEVFLDGEPAPPLTVDSGYSNQPFQLLFGRLTTILDAPLPHGKTLDDTRRQLIGRMDELTLYDRPLTVEEIRHHYRLGRGQASSK